MTTLGQRIKMYEGCFNNTLMRKTPVVIRVDGKAFHTYVKSFISNKYGPFHEDLNKCMEMAAFEFMRDVQGAKAAYIQSDEVSFLLTDTDRVETDAWFGYNIQKMASVSASIFTGYFNSHTYSHTDKVAFFDSRVFNLPAHEVINYFIWRQADWLRNSVSMLTRYYYSHKEMLNKRQPDMHEMLYEKGVNWADLPDKWKNGVFIKLSENMHLKKLPTVYHNVIFKNDRNVFDEFL